MKKEKMCIACPFQKGHTWGLGSTDKIRAIQEIEESNFILSKEIFACHMKHPKNNIFSFARMQDNDCAGYKMMKENMISSDMHPKAVNNINETGPESYDLKAWAKHEGFVSKLGLLDY